MDKAFKHVPSLQINDIFSIQLAVLSQLRLQSPDHDQSTAWLA